MSGNVTTTATLDEEWAFIEATEWWNVRSLIRVAKGWEAVAQEAQSTHILVGRGRSPVEALTALRVAVMAAIPMTTQPDPAAEPEQDDVAFLTSVADRLSKALYYVTTGPIGTDGSVSPGLLHDDYDRLRALAKRMQIESLEARLAILKDSSRD